MRGVTNVTDVTAFSAQTFMRACAHGCRDNSSSGYIGYIGFSMVSLL